MCYSFFGSVLFTVEFNPDDIIGLVVSELASHCYDPGLIPGSSITCKLSLLLCPHPCTHSFSLGPPSTKTIIPNSHSPWKHGLRGKSGKSLNWFYWQTWELVSMKFASNFIWQKHVLCDQKSKYRNVWKKFLKTAS